jgi:hypothetical protein
MVAGTRVRRTQPRVHARSNHALIALTHGGCYGSRSRSRTYRLPGSSLVAAFRSAPSPLMPSQSPSTALRGFANNAPNSVDERIAGPFRRLLRRPPDSGALRAAVTSGRPQQGTDRGLIAQPGTPRAAGRASLPSGDLSSPGAEATPEIVAAYAHRGRCAEDQVVRTACHFRLTPRILATRSCSFPEQHIDLAKVIEKNCSGGCRVRIAVAVANPDSEHVPDRDAMEHLNGWCPWGESEARWASDEVTPTLVPIDRG